MSENTKIEWCDHTFNPWEGCQKVGPGCDHCYAEARNARFAGGTAVNWGTGAPRRRTSEANWNLPKRWNAQADAFMAQHGHRQRVFCASLADVFDNAVPAQWRRDLFDLIDATPNLDWLLLTKRIGNARSLYGEAFLDSARAWPENIWIGATIVNQAEADRDIPKLLAVPARVRFLSMEPLLGAVDITRWIATAEVTCKKCSTTFSLHEADPCEHKDMGSWTLACPNCGNCKCKPGWTPAGERLHYMEPPSDWVDRKVGRFDRVHPTIELVSAIDWVIVGGESGPGARPMHPDWARRLRDQCAAARVPFLFKQWGNWRAAAWFDGPDSEADNDDDFVDLDRTEHVFIANDGRTWDTLGGCYMYPPLPLGHWCLMVNEGKKAAGRHLDGRTWDGVPA